MTWPTQQGVYNAGDLTLQSGARIQGARLSWKAHGTLTPARDNVIVYPTSYGAQHPDLEWLIGPGKILDPDRWFIVIPDMFGNGLSSSPSDTPDYPTLVTIHEPYARAPALLTVRFPRHEIPSPRRLYRRPRRCISGAGPTLP